MKFNDVKRLKSMETKISHSKATGNALTVSDLQVLPSKW